jgi:DNA-binding transcriptional LysR family regulator
MLAAYSRCLGHKKQEVAECEPPVDYVVKRKRCTPPFSMTVPLSKLDLNLLRVFDAVMEERSVLRAGQRICLSQSAVSHALARLRVILEDELFLRTATGMQPTARALAMGPLIRQAGKSLEAAVALPKFEPRSSTRRFTIAVSDFVTMVILPKLLGLLGREAPLVDLVIKPDCRIGLTEQLDLGQIDAAIGTFSDVPARFRSSSLFAYDDVLIASSSRELGDLSPEKLSSLSIAVVAPHGEHDGVVDGFVFERGLARRSEMYDRPALERAFCGSKGAPRIAVSLPHFLALSSLLDNTDLAAIVPRQLAKWLARTHRLSAHELPYRTALVDVSVLWHERNTGDAPQDWLRELLTQCGGSLSGRLGEPERAVDSRQLLLFRAL